MLSGRLSLSGTRCGRPSWDIEPVQNVFEQVVGFGSEETLCSRGPVGPADQVVVEDRQHLQFARAELMQVVMTQRQLPVPSLHARTGTLEQCGTPDRLALQRVPSLRGQRRQETVRSARP